MPGSALGLGSAPGAVGLSQPASATATSMMVAAVPLLESPRRASKRLVRRSGLLLLQLELDAMAPEHVLCEARPLLVGGPHLPDERVRLVGRCLLVHDAI